MKQSVFFAMIIAVITFSSCGPYKKPRYVNIGTNETAFLIPLEAGNKDGQKMLRSIEYLEQKKVSTKRVYIEQTQISTGRLYTQYKYIATDTVVIVHRAPVTREWTKPITKDGTDSHNQTLNVESKESIGFDIPVNSTASVLEENAALFLYNFGGQSIEWVMDHNVRPYILDLLTIEFGKLSLDECQLKRTVVYDTMKVRTKKFFEQYGLTIINLGVAGEYTYTDPGIQEAINSKFISEMKITAARNEATAAEEFAKAAESIKKQKELDANVNLLNSLAQAAREGNLTWPDVLVIGKDQSVFDVWAAKNLSANPK